MPIPGQKMLGLSGKMYTTTTDTGCFEQLLFFPVKYFWFTSLNSINHFLHRAQQSNVGIGMFVLPCHLPT